MGCLALLSLLVSGCVLPDHGRPAPLPLQDYIVNRDGVYYVGLRCTQDLLRVAVVRDHDVSVDEAWPRPDQVLWEAKAEPPGKSEIQLFATELPDGSVVHENQGVIDYTDDLRLYLRDGHDVTLQPAVVLSEIASGYVWATGADRLYRWEEYQSLPDKGFTGCDS